MSEVKRIGRYEVGALIAKGPVGAVYRGESNGKQFALKLVHASQVTPERLAKLRESAGALARVRHPAVVPFVEMIEHAKTLCLVSELAEGESLAALVKAGDFPDMRKTWDIMRQVLEALEAAHMKGVYHGSLKPTNVFIDRSGRVTVSDFGIANLTAEEGIPDFMAPEQLSEALTDARTDIYQAGAMTYLLVTHFPPFSGPREEVAHRVMQERPVDPSTLAKKVAWQLDWVVQRALCKDPADRFNAAREFLDGLRLGLQESLGAPLPLAPAPSAAAAAPEKKAAAAPKPVPAAEKLLAQKAKIIAARPTAPAAEAKPPEPAKTRVLFVDDDERVLNALRTLFRDEYDVSIAVGGAAALEFLKANPAQIVVSDQRMPGMAGVEVLREIKKVTPRTVRILLTGYSDLAAMVGSINEGEVFRFVKKPWDNDDIRAVMKEAAAVAAKLPPPAPAKLQEKRVAASLLVIDTDTALAKGLQRMLGADVSVHEAASAADAAKVLQAHDVAAVVADLRAGSTGIVSLFKLLKAKRPNTLSILLSDQPDSEIVTELINQAHVHRFLAKPVSGKDLQTHVSEALSRYSGLAQGVASLPNGLVPHTA